MPWSGIAAAGLGALGSIAGGLLGNSSRSSANLLSYKQNKKLQERDQAFQREVYQNQYQWKAADARKAGLHPLSIIGGGAYSASPSSVPSQVLPSDYSFLGDLGNSIGDAFAAYKNKKQLEIEAAIKDERDQKLFNAQLEEIQARTRMYGANAFEATQRAMGYTVPWATGNEVIKGQVDAPDAGSSYAVRPVGNGLYDINMSTSHQQELGDELGQLYNFIRKGTRERGRFWKHPVTGESFRFDPESGYWRKGSRESYERELKEYNSKKNQINRRFDMFSREPVYKREDSWWWPF